MTAWFLAVNTSHVQIPLLVTKPLLSFSKFSAKFVYRILLYVWIFLIIQEMKIAEKKSKWTTWECSRRPTASSRQSAANQLRGRGCFRLRSYKPSARTEKNVYGNSLLVLTEAAKGIHTKHDPTRHVTDGTSSIVHALFFPSVHVKERNFPRVLIPSLPHLKKKTTKSSSLLSSLELLSMTSLTETTTTEISSRRYGKT